MPSIVRYLLHFLVYLSQAGHQLGGFNVVTGDLPGVVAPPNGCKYQVSGDSLHSGLTVWFLARTIAVRMRGGLERGGWRCEVFLSVQMTVSWGEE